VLYTEEQTGEQIEVPNVIGMTASQANATISNAGLNIKVVNDNSSSTGTAVVNKQTPEQGAKVNKGSVVTVQFKYSDDVH
jgi:stage V sporulation protein D (sporulation-specific penicillin-binding protein)